MSKSIIVSLKDFEKLPKYSTELSVGRTKGDIDGLLYDMKVKKTAWIREGDQSILLFTIEATIGGQKVDLGFKLSPTLIYVRKKVLEGGHYVEKTVPELNASWRLFYDLLQRKLVSIRYGITSVEAEFMSNIVVPISKTETATLGELMEQGRVLPALEQRPEEPQADRTPVEVDYTVKEEPKDA